MKKTWQIEDLDDIRQLQNMVKKEGEDRPMIGPVEIDLGFRRVFIPNQDVTHSFTPEKLIQMMAAACGISVKFVK